MELCWSWGEEGDGKGERRESALVQTAHVQAAAHASSATAALESTECLSLLLLSQGAVLLHQPTVPAGFYFTFIFLMAWVA